LHIRLFIFYSKKYYLQLCIIDTMAVYIQNQLFIKPFKL